MKAAGPLFHPAHRSVTPFADDVRRDGPFVSLFLDTSPDVDHPSKMVEARWKTARRALGHEGAPEALLALVDPHIEGAHTHGATLAVVVNTDGALHVAHHPAPPKRDIAVYAPLPRLTPLLEWSQKSVPYMVVVIDRTGADITTVNEDGFGFSTTVQSNDPDDVQKTKPGGWSQPRYHRRVENAWEEGAEAVAEIVTHLADELIPDVIVVAGDVRAVEMFTKDMPSRFADKLEIVHGSRADGSDRIDHEVERLVATAAASATVELLHKFRDERGQSDRASDGPTATFEALARAQVETLLVSDDPNDDRQAWFGSSPEQVGIDRSTVEAMAVDEPRQGRLVDVAIRAAIGTGAGVWIVPRSGGPTDGVGAVLRWA